MHLHYAFCLLLLRGCNVCWKGASPSTAVLLRQRVSAGSPACLRNVETLQSACWMWAYQLWLNIALLSGFVARIHQATKLSVGRPPAKGPAPIGDAPYFLTICMSLLLSALVKTGLQVAVQMNDTHPTIAVAEFMRLLAPCSRHSRNSRNPGSICGRLKKQASASL